MNRHTNFYRQRSGRTQVKRIELLEEEFLPEPPHDSSLTGQFWVLTEWAKSLPPGDVRDRFYEISRPYSRLATEFVHILHEASESGEIVLGERFPRLFTGQWNLSPEHRERLAEHDRELCRMVDEMKALQAQVEQGRRR